MVGSKELIRDMNRTSVLETIINEGPLSRAAISKKLGLTKATISTIVQDLLDTFYVEEIGSDDTLQGRKPILLQFCSQNGYIISLDVGVSSTTCMISDLLGHSCRLFQYPFHPTRENLFPFLCRTLRSHLENLPCVPFGVVGIGIGIHGTVRENEIMFTPNYDLAGYPICKRLEQLFHIPVYLENEANLSALAEKTFVENHRNLIHISIHSGVGAGIILEHSLYTGLSGTAGEFGHTVIEPDGLCCPCGSRGCLEQYISDPAVWRFYQRQRGFSDDDEVCSLSQLAAAYLAGEPAALHTVEHFIRYLSLGIQNLWNLFSPDCIIINSQLVSYLPDLLSLIEKRLPARFTSSCLLKGSSLQDTGVLLGGVKVCASHFLRIEKLCLGLF